MSAIHPDQFSNPFSYIDAKRAEFAALRLGAKNALKAYGWVLQPNHPVTGGWRARSWTRDEGARHLRAATAEALISLARDDFERRTKGARR